MFDGQTILPAIKKMKDFEKVLESNYTYIVILDLHISQLVVVSKYAKAKKKKLLLHADMIQGLKSDKYAAEFLCQTVRPAGLISTRADVLKTAKKNGLLAIQRLFLLDTIALETSYRLADKVQPDLIEVLPGVVPDLIKRVQTATGISIITGGLIESKDEIDRALASGAHAITTSRQELWDIN
ncbi:glycerol-3-phosphate responsive antiterminator [Alkalicoccobacillus porphyridii]|uniref:Glycerol uptake operon antiterminator regulatory protein n=1 Tax=Alkalicoccobacillus porphyridii TaxID=2597270 RepID=A0A553ZUU5_9BACI|nr:glycerol-3-phosphate responsive antiterminator [Alkalicoccobacillus porphyridii]TSB45260.1 glycerol-3-phosphate responsive antiterminator [Alkalicoccobacillus porphyridii]